MGGRIGLRDALNETVKMGKMEGRINCRFKAGNKLPSWSLLPYNFVLLNGSRCVGVIHALLGRERAGYIMRR